MSQLSRNRVPQSGIDVDGFFVGFILYNYQKIINIHPRLNVMNCLSNSKISLVTAALIDCSVPDERDLGGFFIIRVQISTESENTVEMPSMYSLTLEELTFLDSNGLN